MYSLIVFALFNPRNAVIKKGGNFCIKRFVFKLKDFVHKGATRRKEVKDVFKLQDSCGYQTAAN